MLPKIAYFHLFSVKFAQDTIANESIDSPFRNRLFFTKVYNNFVEFSLQFRMTEIGTKCVFQMVTEKRAVHIASVKSDSIYRFCHAVWQLLSSEPPKETENASGDATPSFGICQHFEFQFVRIQITTFCSSTKQLTEFVSSAHAFKFRLQIRI